MDILKLGIVYCSIEISGLRLSVLCWLQLFIGSVVVLITYIPVKLKQTYLVEFFNQMSHPYVVCDIGIINSLSFYCRHVRQDGRTCSNSSYQPL